MSGAKGIYFFVVTPTTPTNYPDIFFEGIKLTKQLNPIKSLCLYGESLKSNGTSDTLIQTKNLISENALVSVVLNNSIDFKAVNIIQQDWSSSIKHPTFSLTVEVPKWITVEEIYEQTPDGKKAVSAQVLANNTWIITDSIQEDTRVFVFAKKDKVAPNVPFNLVWADSIDATHQTLSWEEPFDNFGVKGYYIYGDHDQLIDSVRWPIYDVDLVNCSSRIRIRAYDEAGNVSNYAEISKDGFTTCVNIREVEINKWKIYPNPNKGNFTIETDLDFKETTVSIIDVSGRSLLQEKIKSKLHHISVVDFAKGIYFMNIENESSTSSQKIIIQ